MLYSRESTQIRSADKYALSSFFYYIQNMMLTDAGKQCRRGCVFRAEVGRTHACVHMDVHKRGENEPSPHPEPVDASRSSPESPHLHALVLGLDQAQIKNIWGKKMTSALNPFLAITPSTMQVATIYTALTLHQVWPVI